MVIDEHLQTVREGRGAIKAHWDSPVTLKPFELSKANLRRLNLFQCDLHDSVFTQADLRGAVLAEANLSGALLGGTILVDADLREADLGFADLTGADLRGANLKGANLYGAIFARSDGASSVRIDGANLKGIKMTPQGTGGFGSFLDLACVQGLENAHFGTHGEFTEYIEQAFSYAHRDDIYELEATPGLVHKALTQIRALREQYRSAGEPKKLVEVVGLVTKELLQYVAHHPEELDQIRPRQFEELIAEILASFGWEVELTPQTRDGGYDIFAVSRDVSGVRNHWIIECKKNRRDRTIGVDVVRSLYGVKKVMSGANAMLATTSYFSKGAHEFKASRYDLDLRNRESVLEWLGEISTKRGDRIHSPSKELWVPGDPPDREERDAWAETSEPLPTAASLSGGRTQGPRDEPVPLLGNAVSPFGQLESKLNRFVVHQESAVRALVVALEHSASSAPNSNRPRAALMLHGPAGVGKSHLARQIGRLLFGDERAALFFNMAGFIERLAASKLIGARPGYVGYEQGGELTGKVRDRPKSVVVLEEIELAHQCVFDPIVKEIVSSGTLTDTFDGVVDFTETILLLTSRRAPSFDQDVTTDVDEAPGEEAQEEGIATEDEKLADGAGSSVPPEILNLLDATVELNSLRPRDFEEIVRLQIEVAARRLQDRGVRVDISQGVIDLIVSRISDDGEGAHAVTKTVERCFLDPLAEFLMRNEDQPVISIGARIGDASESEIVLDPTFPESESS